jgi:hypothetical protein
LKRPHWRRGHFRRQPCGHGRSQCRLVFVRPCFINAGHFHGDLADTSYSIHAVQTSAVAKDRSVLIHSAKGARNES